MAKLFVVSDIHGFYDEMMKALDEAGFDPSNEEHFLISLGDNFDRGPKNKKVMDYLMSLERKILVQGNHESLMKDLCRRRYPYQYDVSNGTYGAVCELGVYGYTDFAGACDLAMKAVRPLFDSMVDYFETENYIFVHSFIPLNLNDATFDPNWREASYIAWDENARWGNPFLLADQGLLPEKTLVFGHFHTSWPRAYFDDQPEWGEDADFSPYYGDGYIGIDACCAYSGQINCIVLEDNFL